MEKSNAIVITGGYLDTYSAKTAHGLIRGTDRFNIIALIDHKHPGRDAGEVLDGKKRNIPIYATITDFVKTAGGTAKYCIVGVSNQRRSYSRFSPGFVKGSFGEWVEPGEWSARLCF